MSQAFQVGIRRLLNENTYTACFPLHEGRWDKSEPDGKVLDRRVRSVNLYQTNRNLNKAFVAVAIFRVGQTK